LRRRRCNRPLNVAMEPVTTATTTTTAPMLAATAARARRRLALATDRAMTWTASARTAAVGGSADSARARSSASITPPSRSCRRGSFATWQQPWKPDFSRFREQFGECPRSLLRCDRRGNAAP